jgi:Uma2 family endonuclease
MVAMTVADAESDASREYMVDDLDRTPDDGRRYELIDGVLVVSPAPAWPHQRVAFELAILLSQQFPANILVIPGPGVRMSLKTELIPDIVAVRRADLTLSEARITKPPLLAVEVRSPSTALFDLNIKKAVYERFGIESYWIVVPDIEKPELIAFELRDGKYVEEAHVIGEQLFRAKRPFDVEIVPSALVAGLRDQ